MKIGNQIHHAHIHGPKQKRNDDTVRRWHRVRSKICLTINYAIVRMHFQGRYFRKRTQFGIERRRFTPAKW